MPWPKSQFQIDEGLVRSLVDTQMPEFKGLHLREAATGFDNSLWRLGDDYLVRLPRRNVAIGLMENEIRWLPTIVEYVPLPIPAPVKVGRPSADYPCPWTVTKWFEGLTGDVAVIADSDGVACDLGGFLRALHVPAPRGAPRNPLRGVALSERAVIFEGLLNQLHSQVNEHLIRNVWRRAVNAETWDRDPVWIHGDLHPANLIFGNGSLKAVIDFGDVCAGDPATDLAGVWMLLPEESIPLALHTYGNDDAALIARSLGWAALFGLFFVELGLEGRESYMNVGTRTMEVLSHCSG